MSHGQFQNRKIPLNINTTTLWVNPFFVLNQIHNGTYTIIISMQPISNQS